jgi:uncharacterized damage-inducible protein DinB
MLQFCARLTDEQLDATLNGTYGSIRSTLEHMVKSERSYFSRISTGKRYDWPADIPPMTAAQMLESARASGQRLIDWAPRVQPTDTVQVMWKDGTPTDVPLTVIVTQAINHATEHRSQIMTLLTQLGIEPPSLDGWSYFDAHR